MSEDIASLGVSVDSSSAVKAKTDLDNLTQAGAAASSSVRDLGYATASTAQETANYQAKLIAALQAQYGLTEAEAAATLGIKLQGAAAIETAGIIENANTKVNLSMMQTVGMMQVARSVLSGNMEMLAGSSAVLAARLGLLTEATLAFFLPIAAIGAAVVGAAFLIYKLDEAEKELTATTIGLGAKSELTSVQLQDIADDATRSFGQAGAAALKQAEQFAGAGVQSEDTIASLTNSLGPYAALMGEKVPAAQKQMAEAIKDPIKGAQDLNEALGILDATQMTHITTLTTLGDKEGALAILSDALRTRTDEARSAGIGLTTTMGNLATGVGEAWAAMMKLNDQLAIFANGGKTPDTTPQQKAAAAAAAAAQAQARGNQISTAANDIANETPENAAALKLQELVGKTTQLQAGILVEQQRGNTEQVQKDTIALNEYNAALERTQNALSKYGNQLGIDTQIAKDQAQLRREKGGARTATETELYGLQHLGDIETDSDLAQRARNAGGIKGAGRPPAAHEDNADKYSDETAKVNQTAAAQLAYATALDGSTFAGLQAKAMQDALTAAFEKSLGPKGQVVDQTLIAARAQANLEAAISKTLITDAQAANSQQDKIDTQKQINALVEAGGITEQEAAAQVANNTRIRLLQNIALHGTVSEMRAAGAEILNLINLANQQKDTDAQTTGIKITDEINKGLAAFNEARDKREETSIGPNQTQTADNEAAKNVAAIIALENNSYGVRLANRARYIAQVENLTKGQANQEQLVAKAAAVYDQQTLQSRLQYTEQFFGDLASLSSSKNREIAAIGKAAAVIQATIDGVLAVQKTIATTPYPWNIPLAAAEAAVAAANVAKIAGLKGGGIIGGNGGPTEDNHVIRISTGEAVVKASAVERYRPQIEQMNNDVVPRFAAGGIIGNFSSASPSGTSNVFNMQGSNFGGNDPDAIMKGFHDVMETYYKPTIVAQSVKTTLTVQAQQSKRQKLNQRRPINQ